MAATLKSDTGGRTTEAALSSRATGAMLQMTHRPIGDLIPYARNEGQSR